ncbi:hypothetical protein K474DRAFT_1683878 [Panus rudis PR-1116 ss-1]|nr:hypothetical protein K474DRAFT_1683878 [Panus rudis PR-1116 ss-1]
MNRAGNPLKPGFFSEACYNLIYLELAACRLEQLPDEFARLVPNLRVLNLNYNFLEETRALEGLTRLRKLSIIGSRIAATKHLVRVLRGMEDIEMLDFRMNPCTLGWYLPLLVKDVPGALQPSDGDHQQQQQRRPGSRLNAFGGIPPIGEEGPSTVGIGTKARGANNQPSSSSSTRGSSQAVVRKGGERDAAAGSATWKDLDAKFRRDLPDETYAGRMVYRGLVMRACPAIRMLDGIEVSEKERDKAERILKEAVSVARKKTAEMCSMIDTQPTNADAQPLNSYNVAQLQFALEDSKAIDSLSFNVHVFEPLSDSASPAVLPDADPDYLDRRMSSSAASDSSLQSRPDKRALSPSLSPDPRTSRYESADYESKSELGSPALKLPSIASIQDRAEARRASLPTLYSESQNRLRLPQPNTHRPSQSTSGLSSYQFPPPSNEDDKRPRLATDLYTDYSLSTPALSSNSSFSFSGQSPLSAEYKSPSSGLPLSDEHWASGIARPNSTPGQLPGALSPGIKYEDGIRHSSLSGPGSQQQLFGGVTRISGQQHHHADRGSARSSLVQSIKTENDWSFSNAEYPMSAASTASSGMPSSASAPSISVNSSPTRSPQAPPPSLVDRQPRKRGKLPKPVTDFLKDWLHRHSDHPYPSEEEKKQLCHATGLSMSQVSNWMINARRRILAPAHRAAAGPTTTTPFSSRSGPPMLDAGRRASMPADSLQLYYPMTLQSYSDGPLSSTRHMVGMSRSLSSSHASVGSLSATAGHHNPYESSYGSNRLSYGQSVSTLHPHAQSHGGGSSAHGGSAGAGGGYLSVPMSAPPISNPNPFMSSQSHQQQTLYSSSTSSNNSPYMHSPQSSSGRVLTPHEEASHVPSPRYAFPDTHSSSPQPGSGFGTPQ